MPTQVRILASAPFSHWTFPRGVFKLSRAYDLMVNQILLQREFLNELYPTKNNKRWILAAEKRNFLPLLASPELAQICGHLMGDGYLRVTKKVGGRVKFFGDSAKLKKLAKLYQLLFKRHIPLVKRKRSNFPGYKLEITDSVVARCLSKIGVPAGDKVISKFGIPNWILASSKEVKRRFLQAIFDDELEGLYQDKYKLGSWKGLRLRMNKNSRLSWHSLVFFQQIRDLLSEFRIRTSKPKIYCTESYLRKDGVRTVRLSFRILNNLKNRKQFLKEIGFIYSKVKQKSLVKSCGF